MDWTGRSAFITAGVSGIGFGIARAYSNAGLRLALSYRNEAYREQATWTRGQRRQPGGLHFGAAGGHLHRLQVRRARPHRVPALQPRPHGIGVSLVCPGLTHTNGWDCALKRPEQFADSGLGEVDRAELERFGQAFALGMDPLEIGEKVLRGMQENRGLILTHPEHGEDFTEICESSMAALPDEPAPEGRLHIERLRRAANRAAVEGRITGLGDLT